MLWGLKALELSEPEWGHYLMDKINGFVESYELLERYVPLFSDVFVLTYPFYLVFVYLWAALMEKLEIKIASLHIFFTVFFAGVCNQVVKLFVYKARPSDIELSTEGLIFENVPVRAFPSDHASVSMSMALGTFLRGLYHKNIFFVISGIVFFVFSLIMSFARIASWLHRVTDILVGWLIALVVSFVLIKTPLYDILKEKLYKPLISLQVWLFSLVGIDR